MEKSSKGKKGLIAVIVLAVLAGLAAVLIIFVFGKNSSGFDSPEAVAKTVLDVSYAKDWKPIIEMTTDEEMEVILKVDAEKVQEKGISTVSELRSWAMEHASEIPDPMNGRAIKQCEIGRVITMPASEYIELFLGGETEGNAYYSFLKSKDSVSVVEVNYVMVDGDKEYDRVDTVIAYEKDGRWYSVVGIMVIDIML